MLLFRYASCDYQGPLSLQHSGPLSQQAIKKHLKRREGCCLHRVMSSAPAGADYGSQTAQLVAKHGFPQVCCCTEGGDLGVWDGLLCAWSCLAAWPFPHMPHSHSSLLQFYCCINACWPALPCPACPAFLPPQDKRLGAGVIDGRGIWADDGLAARLVAALRRRLGPQHRISVQVRGRGGGACLPFASQARKSAAPASIACIPAAARWAKLPGTH